MSSRFLKNHSYVANNTLAQLDNFTTPIGSKINVYKFRKVSGILRFTNEGEKSLYSKIIDFQQATNIYTGKDPITVVWSNSTKAYLGKDNLTIYKEYSVGDYYELYSNGANSNSLVIDSVDILGKTYVNSYIDRDIILTSYNWAPNDDDILDYVYLILDPVNKSLQWLEINNTTPYYNEETKQFQYCEITFSNINLKYSKSGKTLLDFIQFGAIGEGYAFPVEEYDSQGNIVVKLDEEKKIRNNDGINQMQFDFNSGAGNSSFFIIGRKKEIINEEGKIILDKPHLLFPYKCNFPKSSPFFYNKPNMNSYALINTLPTKDGIWKSYKEAYKGNERIGDYNIDKEKQVLTGFTHNLDDVRNTNENMNTYINWDNNNSIKLTLDVNLDAIPYVDKSVKKIDRYVNYATFFVINSFLNFYTDTFNYDYRETTKYKLTDVLGILGGLVNILVGGLDIGWTSKSSLGPKQPINFLLPCISFEDGKSALSDDAPLPTDIFIDSNVKKVLPTANNVLTSWNFSLTDRFQDEGLILEGKPLGKGGNGVWDTKYLGQTKDEDGNLLFDDGRPLLLNLQRFKITYPSSTRNDFIVDYVDYKSVGICDTRISAYNIQDENIYSCYMETNAKARDEITIWGNQMKFNYYDEFNTIGQSQWPVIVELPKPDITKIAFYLEEMHNAEPFTINGNFGNSLSGWNGYHEINQYTTDSSCSQNHGCRSSGYYYRVFVPDNKDFLYKDNQIVDKTFNCDISEINIDFFKTLRITFFDDNYIDFDLVKDKGIIKEFQFSERLFSYETRTGIYSRTGENGGIYHNSRTKHSVITKLDIIDGKDRCLLVASTDNNNKLELSFDILNSRTLQIKSKVSYNKVFISLNDEPTDLEYTWSKPSAVYSRLQTLNSDLTNLFSQYRIKNVIIIPKEIN